MHMGPAATRHSVELLRPFPGEFDQGQAVPGREPTVETASNHPKLERAHRGLVKGDVGRDNEIEVVPIFCLVQFGNPPASTPDRRSFHSKSWWPSLRRGSSAPMEDRCRGYPC